MGGFKEHRMANTTVAAVSGYIKTHERLLIVVLCLIFTGWVTNKGLTIYQGYEQGKLTNLEQQLNETKQQTAAAQQSAQDAKNTAQVIAVQATQDKAASATLIASLSQQNASLASQIVKRGNQTEQQQQVDLTTSIPGLDVRFKVLVPNVNPADVHVSPDGKTVSIGEDTAQKVVSQLELVPPLQGDKKDLEAEVKNGQDMLASSQKALDTQSKLTDAQQKVIDAQDKYNGLLETQLKQADAVCQEKVNIEKTNTKKAYFKGFKWGAVAGFIAGVFTGHAL
jgi:hypothetical protein